MHMSTYPHAVCVLSPARWAADILCGPYGSGATVHLDGPLRADSIILVTSGVKLVVTVDGSTSGGKCWAEQYENWCLEEDVLHKMLLDAEMGSEGGHVVLTACE